MIELRIFADVLAAIEVARVSLKESLREVAMARMVWDVRCGMSWDWEIVCRIWERVEIEGGDTSGIRFLEASQTRAEAAS